jgi:hypothetical protein
MIFAFSSLLNEKSIKKNVLYRFSFVCFAAFMVQTLPARGHKTEKQRNSLTVVNHRKKLYKKRLILG